MAENCIKEIKMKVYNEAKTEELAMYDLTKGYLKDDVLVTHIPAQEEVREVSHEVVLQEYPNGGKDVEIVIDVPYRAEVPAHDEEEKIQVYIPYTAKEIEENEARATYYANKKRLTELTEDFIQDLAGQVVPDMAGRREEFQRLHDAVRIYEGKTPRDKQEDVL